eukprot:g2606.t1
MLSLVFLCLLSFVWNSPSSVFVSGGHKIDPSDKLHQLRLKLAAERAATALKEGKGFPLPTSQTSQPTTPVGKNDLLANPLLQSHGLQDISQDIAQTRWSKNLARFPQTMKSQPTGWHEDLQKVDKSRIAEPATRSDGLSQQSNSRSDFLNARFAGLQTQIQNQALANSEVQSQAKVQNGANSQAMSHSRATTSLGSRASTGTTASTGAGVSMLGGGAGGIMTGGLTMRDAMRSQTDTTCIMCEFVLASMKVLVQKGSGSVPACAHVHSATNHNSLMSMMTNLIQVSSQTKGLSNFAANALSMGLIGPSSDQQQNWNGEFNQQQSVGKIGIGIPTDPLAASVGMDNSQRANSLNSGKGFGSDSLSRPLNGRQSILDLSRIQDSAKKELEFARWYNTLMDAMDCVCWFYLPEYYQNIAICKWMYLYSDKLVEMWLHDYDDWDICQAIPNQKYTFGPKCESVTLLKSENIYDNEGLDTLDKKPNIGISLSGGGPYAAAFTYKFMNALEKIFPVLELSTSSLTGFTSTFGIPPKFDKFIPPLISQSVDLNGRTFSIVDGGATSGSGLQFLIANKEIERVILLRQEPLPLLPVILRDGPNTVFHAPTSYGDSYEKIFNSTTFKKFNQSMAIQYVKRLNETGIDDSILQKTRDGKFIQLVTVYAPFFIEKKSYPIDHETFQSFNFTALADTVVKRLKRKLERGQEVQKE